MIAPHRPTLNTFGLLIMTYLERLPRRFAPGNDGEMNEFFIFL